jgi:hypothetical protein
MAGEGEGRGGAIGVAFIGGEGLRGYSGGLRGVLRQETEGRGVCLWRGWSGKQKGMGKAGGNDGGALLKGRSREATEGGSGR